MNRWNERRRRLAGEDGFSLLMTLIIMGVAFLMISALLFLTLTTATVSNSQLARAKEWRAADGALDAATNKILQDPTGTTGSINEAACKPVQNMNIGDLDVRVKCTSVSSEEPFVTEKQTDPKAVKVVGTQYRGEPAAIANAAKNWKELPTTCPVGDDCFPWVETLAGKSGYSSGGRLAADGATVLATGPQPLQIIGDMAVRKGTAAALNARADGGVRNTGPGIAVRGEYSQGDAGLLNNVVGPISSDGPTAANEVSCGLLSKNKDSSWRDNTNVTATSGIFCSDTTTSSTHPAAASTLSAADPAIPRVNPNRPPAASMPSCSSGTLVTFTQGAYTKAQTATINTWLSSGDACTGKVFWFQPGRYWFDVDDPNPSLGSRLWRNELRFLDPNITTVFGSLPGGTLAGLDAAKTAGQPLCDAKQPGVNITLSARTSIRHEAGRVAICGGSDNPIAIEQAHAVNTGWESDAANMAGGSVYRCVNTTFIDFCGVSAFLVGITNSAVNWVNGTFGFNIPGIPTNGKYSFTGPTTQSATCPTLNLAAQCWMDVLTTFSGWDSRGDTVGAPITSAQLLLDTTNTSASGNGSTTRIDVVPTGASTPLCSVTYDGTDVRYDAPDRQGMIGVYDLLATSGRASRTPGLPMCGDRDSTGRTLLNDRLQLYGSKIGVKLSARMDGALGSSSLAIRGAKLRTDAPVTTGSVSAGGGVTTGAGAGIIWRDCVLEWGVYDLDLFFFTIPIPYPKLPGTCPSTGQGTFSIPSLLADDTTFSSDPSATGRLNPRVTALGVDLAGDAVSASDLFYSASDEGSNYVRVSLMAGSTRVCTTQYRSGGGTQFLLPDDDRTARVYLGLVGNGYTGDNGCAGTMANYRASDLVGKSLEVTVYTGQTTGENIGCYAAISGSLRGWFAGLFGAECSGWGYRVDSLDVRSSFGDCVGVGCETTVANTYDGSSTPMSVTSALQDNATFNVYGDVSLPRSDLDVYWAGSFVTDPIVTGNLWVNAIGSMARTTGSAPPKVGILCCAAGKPSERVVRLEAWVGNKLRGSAEVSISDTNTEIAGGDPSTLDPNSLLDETWRPGVSVRVKYWQLCNNKPVADPDATGANICQRS